MLVLSNNLNCIFRAQTSPAAFNQNQRNYQTYEVPPGGYNQGYNNHGHQNQGGYYQNQGYNQNYGGYNQNYDNVGGYNQGHNQGEKDTSVKLDNQEYVVQKRSLVDENVANVRVKKQKSIVESDSLVDEKDACVMLENQEPVVIKESVVDISKDFIEISSEEDGSNVKPKETELKTDKKRHPRSCRNRVRKLKAKGIANDIAKQLAEMEPEQMLKFVKHNVSDLNKVKSYLEDVNTAKSFEQEQIRKKNINAIRLWKSNYFKKRRPIIIHIKDNINSLDKRQMNIIRCCLIKEMVLTNESNRPKILQWSFRQNYIEVKCAGIETTLWLQRHVTQLTPWPNAKLSAYVNNPNININKRRINKIYSVNASAKSINDDKDVPKSSFNVLTTDYETKNFDLSLSKNEFSNDGIISNTVGSSNNMSMLNVKEFDIKIEESQRAKSEPFIFDDIKHTMNVNNLVTNSKTNIITETPHIDENSETKGIVWKTNVEDSTLIDNCSKTVINPLSVLKTSAVTNAANFTNNITIVHKKLSGAQKRKRKRALEATEIEERSGHRNKMAKNDVDVKICINPFSTEGSIQRNIVNDSKSTGINNLNTEKIQSSLSTNTYSNTNTPIPVTSKRKNKRRKLREKQRFFNERETVPLYANTNSACKVNPNKIRMVVDNQFNTVDESGSTSYTNVKNSNTQIAKYETENKDVIVISDDDTPVCKITDLYKAYRNKQNKASLKKNHGAGFGGFSGSIQ